MVVPAFIFPSRGFRSAPMVTVLVEGAPFVFWPRRVYEWDDSVEALARTPTPANAKPFRTSTVLARVDGAGGSYAWPNQLHGQANTA
jgi:hypothetical protein